MSGEALKHKDRCVISGMVFYSGYNLFARDVQDIVIDLFNVSISPKGVARRMVYLEDLGYIERIPFDSSDALYNRCRYAYRWVPEELRN